MTKVKKSDYLDESIKLEGIYSECNAHLKEQSTKRDQLLAFYGALIGLIIGNLESIKGIKYISFIYLAMMISSILLAYVITSYIRWHSIYLFSAKTIQNIMFFKQEKINNKIVKLIYNESLNKEFNIRLYLKKVEVKMLNLYLAVSSVNIYIYIYLINGTKSSFVLGVVINILYVTLINWKTYRIMKMEFIKKDEDDLDEWLPWCIDLYSYEDKISKSLVEIYECDVIEKEQ